MKALVLTEIQKPLSLQERPPVDPGPREVVVSLRAAALNRRDFWITKGRYPRIKTPVVLGSDGAGTVERIGEGVTSWRPGDEVIVNPGADWGPREDSQQDGFRILGMPDDGTFAAEVLVPASSLHGKPEPLDWVEAAALPLAGLTAYRAVFVRGALQAGQRVLVTGIGGGVATFALQFAVTAGAEVLVTSSSPAKIEKAVELGAAGGTSYRSEDWGRSLRSRYGRVNLAIDGAGGDGYQQLIELASPGGRIVSYGATAGAPGHLDLFKVYWKQLNLLGSTMGSPADFKAMLDFVEEQRIKPVIDAVLELDEASQALERMASSTQFGKIVLRIG